MFKYESDSRKVTKGQTFVALKGMTVDGHDYINNAIENGASAIICEKDIDVNVPYTKVDNTDTYLRKILNDEYGKDIDKMTLIGVTGTNGKTTSCYLIYQMLNNLGIDTAYIGTLGYYHKDDFVELNNTTPDVLTIYKLLYKAYESGAKSVVMEVSSQALSYDRLTNINYSIIGFTNLTEDHLDYHKTMDDYKKAKQKLFGMLRNSRYAIINSDDKYYRDFMFENNYNVTVGKYGNFRIKDVKLNQSSIDIVFDYKKEYHKSINMVGKYNAYNYLEAVLSLVCLGFDLEELLKLDVEAPPGRMYIVNYKTNTIFIDYAHTPDAMENVLKSVKCFCKNKIITIFGCGGNREKTKRSIMGDIATRYSDFVIITNDNPRYEEEDDIINDIAKGISKSNYEIIKDREDAIKKGIGYLENNDILLVLGKGHENYQIIGSNKIHFDDLEIVKKYVNF